MNDLALILTRVEPRGAKGKKKRRKKISSKCQINPKPNVTSMFGTLFMCIKVSALHQEGASTTW